MNRWLTRPVTTDEVKHATFSINSNSAPGEDGFTGAFFQAYWDIVAQDIFEACVSFFGSCRLLQGLKHTLLALIPKGRNVQNMSQAKPCHIQARPQAPDRPPGLFPPLHGIKVSQLAPPITSLFFADDIILFGKVNEQSMVTVRNILTSFEAMSGLKVNLKKSAMFFSRNTPH
ncbi:hypothetical protein Cni_G02837 [Canna indica]|uniref:Reverse transcriptase n=1 Tax=Canna indica TaxID=4628 RepID=A0AAQ3Q2I9_9LILI|nr:hypothetical protein Cni_G02837 [Canna indica]